jgi:hypothetical protein
LNLLPCWKWISIPHSDDYRKQSWFEYLSLPKEHQDGLKVTQNKEMFFEKHLICLILMFVLSIISKSLCDYLSNFCPSIDSNILIPLSWPNNDKSTFLPL